MMWCLLFIFGTFLLSEEALRGIVPGMGRLWPLLALPTVLLYGWMFVFAANAGDLFWRFLYAPVLWLRDRWAGQVYGPGTGNLSETLAGERVVAITSRLDEAEVALQFGAAPRRLYTEALCKRCSTTMRVLEWTLLRPFVLGLFLRTIECVLERYVLGFSWIMVMLFDYEISTSNDKWAYPPCVLERVDVTEDLRPLSRRKRLRTFGRVTMDDLARAESPAACNQIDTLREALEAVGRDLKHQLKLRHSLYYESDAVLERVADALTSEHRSIEVEFEYGQGSEKGAHTAALLSVPNTHAALGR
jgi:hypothetical protein